MAFGIKREQGDDFASALNGQQDRGLFLTDGGTLSWDATTGTLVWSGTLGVRVPGVGTSTVAPGSLSGINSGGDAVYVDISRSASGVVTLGAQSLSLSSNLSETRILLAVRANDNKLYFRNGTVFTNGDSKFFGTLNQKTDRAESIADGNALQTVGFTYVVGSDQLVVYVGGLLQKVGLHYNETSTSQITFLAPYIPASGELLTYMNVIGGEGPPGSGDLQLAYSVGSQIDVTPGTPVELVSTGGVAATQLFRAGNVASPGGVNAVSISRDGRMITNQYLIRDYTTGLQFAAIEADSSGNVRIRSVTPGSEYGIQVNSDGTGVEFGKFPLLGSPGTTGGSIRISEFTGTTSNASATIVATGITTIKSVLVSVYHSGLTNYLVSSFAGTANAAREFHTSFDAAGNVKISSLSDGTGVVPPLMQSQPYTVIVFH